MKGQWIGDYVGTSSGTIVLNIDEMETHYQGTAYVHPKEPHQVKTLAAFRTPDKARSFSFRTSQMAPLKPDTLEPGTWEDIKHLFPPDVRMSSHAEVSGFFDDDNLVMNWSTDIGVSGSTVAPRSKADAVSELKPDLIDWTEFKRRVSFVQGKHGYIYRGQSKPWRLRTAFHRHGRSDLRRFRGIAATRARRSLMSGRMKRVAG